MTRTLTKTELEEQSKKRGQQFSGLANAITRNQNASVTEKADDDKNHASVSDDKTERRQPEEETTKNDEPASKPKTSAKGSNFCIHFSDKQYKAINEFCAKEGIGKTELIKSSVELIMMGIRQKKYIIGANGIYPNE